MTDVFVVRHAEAEGNLFRRAHGCFNGQLTELGKQQLEFLSRRFAPIQLDAVYVSDLRRSIETGQALCAGRGLDVRVEKQVREMNLGIWEDLPWGELQHSYRTQYINFNKYPDRFRMEGAETFDATKRRMLSAVRKLALQHDGQKIAICSHGGAIHALLTAISAENGEMLDQGFSDNTAVSLLQVEAGRVRVLYANDNSHLPPDLTNFARQNWWQSVDSTDSGDLRYVSPQLEGQWMALYEAWMAEIVAPNSQLVAWQDLLALVKRKPNCLSFALSCDVPAGLVLVNADAESSDAGRIYGCFLKKELRGRHYSPQLIGQAISVLRRSGIGKARVCLPLGADAHWGPYFCKYGFAADGRTPDCVTYVKDISL